MDLKERMKDAINTLKLPVTCRLGYLDGKHSPDLRLQILPGSTVIDRDYAGNKTEQYAMEVIMRGDEELVINQVLATIADYLCDNDFRVVSHDGSFVYSELGVASFPHPVMADTTGEVTYVFDFKVTVDTFTKEG